MTTPAPGRWSTLRGQAVEQLVLHGVHQVAGVGSLLLDLPGDGQAAVRSWFSSARMAIL